MRLDVAQDFGPTDAAAIAAAYRSADLSGALSNLPFVGSPESVAHNSDAENGTVTASTRWKVELDLPGVALAFVDPALLTFVEHCELAADGTGTFRIIPEHYPKLLKASGQTAIASDGDTTLRTTSGSLRIDLGWKGKLFEGQVEQAIADGLARSLQAQVPQVLRFIESGS